MKAVHDKIRETPYEAVSRKQALKSLDYCGHNHLSGKENNHLRHSFYQSSSQVIHKAQYIGMLEINSKLRINS